MKFVHLDVGVAPVEGATVVVGDHQLPGDDVIKRFFFVNDGTTTQAMFLIVFLGGTTNLCEQGQDLHLLKGSFLHGPTLRVRF